MAHPRLVAKIETEGFANKLAVLNDAHNAQASIIKELLKK
jgi:hypothetical protein